ncbi:diguanylate cyclase (GGDEF) domain-containing protein [Ruminococcaceae bacterium KH2T8]|nr:diguanylate cyclase (GGDEF) domain-containing protein [Ruminococcaceae bacterium KH2T8]
MIRNIAAVVSGMDEEYPYHIIRGINDVAKKNNVNISYFAAYGNILRADKLDVGELSIYNLPDFAEFDGAILITNTFANPELRDSVIARVKAAHIPTVIFECKEHEEFYDISIDNYSVMKKLVEHLIHEHDCRTLNFVSGPLSNPEAYDRFMAFKDALTENGIEPDERRIFYAGFKSYDGIRAIEDFVKSGLPLPDAFVCANDSMALTLMTKLQRMGYKVPQDVIVTGFDYTFNARNSSPALTTVRRPLYHSGAEACEILLDLMNGKERPHHTLTDAFPVFSGSCGCTPEDNEDIIDFKRYTYQRLEQTYTSVHMLNRLIAGLATASSIEECVEILKQMLNTLDCEKFTLCLVSNWEKAYHTLALEEDTFYSEFMTAPLIWDNGESRSVANFPTCNLMPEELTTGGNVNYFLPIHFDDRCLGYIIMTNSDFPIYSVLCHTMTMSISNAVEHVSKLNVLDPLCKIYNRNGFIMNADKIYKECIEEGSDIVVSFIDLDGLKLINDNYGHKEGDFAIVKTAEAISDCCSDDMVCARFGGDEFVAFGREDRHALMSFEERLNNKLGEINADVSKPYSIAASIGTIIAPAAEDLKIMDIIQMADDKMYNIKKDRKAART